MRIALSCALAVSLCAVLCLPGYAKEKAAKKAAPIVETPAAPAAETAAVETSTAPAAKGLAGEVAEAVVDQAKACAEQKAKLAACDQLKWVAKMACRKLADKKACLGL